MMNVRVIDAFGATHAVEAREGEPLMHALRDEGLVDAVCGGAMSCGTCAVAFDPARAATLVAPDDMEQALLDGLGCGDAGARLSCQVIVTPDMAGLTLNVLPST